MSANCQARVCYTDGQSIGLMRLAPAMGLTAQFKKGGFDAKSH
jgi:hypothetical protein